MGARHQEFAPPQGPRPQLEWVALDRFVTDLAWQRPIDHRRAKSAIAKIARAWDWGLCQTLLAARGDGERLILVDGQHRLAAARLRGDIDKLPCAVITLKRAQKQALARRFMAINTMRRPLNEIEKFRAALAAREADAVLAMELIERAGLRLAPHTNNRRYRPGDFGSPSAVIRALPQFNERAIGAALEGIAKGFGKEPLRYDGTLFQAALAIAEIRPDGDAIAALLARHTQTEWRALAIAWRSERGGGHVLSIRHAARAALGGREGIEGYRALGEFSGERWCAQCEQRVNFARARVCGSRFCALRGER